MPKICAVIFSTNRLEYLTRTLEAQANLDFTGCEVERIFIDDFPKGRNNLLISTLVKNFGYNEIILHETNMGLSVTWSEFWSLIKNRNYDYVWHQEDDIEILKQVSIKDLITILDGDKDLCQVTLQRQPWYFTEGPSQALGSDWTYKNYRYEKNSAIFSPMASLYSMRWVRYDYSGWLKTTYPDKDWWTINLNEGMIGKVLYEGQSLVSGKVKDANGGPLIHHIGEYFVGKRVLPNEPHYEHFEKYDPEIKYNSRDGSLYQG